LAELDVGQSRAAEIGENSRPVDFAGRLSHGGASGDSATGPILMIHRHALKMQLTGRTQLFPLSERAAKARSSSRAEQPWLFGKMKPKPGRSGRSSGSNALPGASHRRRGTTVIGSLHTGVVAREIRLSFCSQIFTSSAQPAVPSTAPPSA
jgi:hypothetical protein